MSASSSDSPSVTTLELEDETTNFNLKNNSSTPKTINSWSSDHELFLHDRFIPTQTRRGELSAKSKISLQSNRADKNIFLSQSQQIQSKEKENERPAKFNSASDILSNYSKKLKIGCYGKYNIAYGNGTEILRDIPLEPERILDAPGIVDDFYLNCLSWSVHDMLAIGLGGSVYLWNSRSGEVNELCNINSSSSGEVEQVGRGSNYISSVSWIHDGSYLAIGSSDSTVQLWDVKRAKKMRMFADHNGRVSALAWNKHILSTGAYDGKIHTHDVRIAQHLISTQSGHTGQICGLQWSYDGRQLASGSNDNNVHIWEESQSSAPVYSFTHTAAVKALAWCPWQSNTLVTGGGSRDRCLKFWNTSSGVLSRSIDTNSQVSAVMWSKTYRELVSAHGYSSNSLCIWKYPSLAQIKEIPTAHDSRILHMAMSPDGERIATVAADENLKIWKVFQPPKESSKASTKTSSNPERPLITISHMTETSAKFKSASSPYSTRSRTTNETSAR